MIVMNFKIILKIQWLIYGLLVHLALADIIRGYTINSPENGSLQKFLTLFQNAEPQMKWIRDTVKYERRLGDNKFRIRRAAHRRKTAPINDESIDDDVDSKLLSFKYFNFADNNLNDNDIDDDEFETHHQLNQHHSNEGPFGLDSIENGDTWYDNYRRKECKNGDDSPYCEHLKKEEENQPKLETYNDNYYPEPAYTPPVVLNEDKFIPNEETRVDAPNDNEIIYNNKVSDELLFQNPYPYIPNTYLDSENISYSNVNTNAEDDPNRDEVAPVQSPSPAPVFLKQEIDMEDKSKEGQQHTNSIGHPNRQVSSLQQSHGHRHSPRVQYQDNQPAEEGPAVHRSPAHSQAQLQAHQQQQQQMAQQSQQQAQSQTAQQVQQTHQVETEEGRNNPVQDQMSHQPRHSAKENNEYSLAQEESGQMRHKQIVAEGQYNREQGQPFQPLHTPNEEELPSYSPIVHNQNALTPANSNANNVKDNSINVPFNNNINENNNNVNNNMNDNNVANQNMNANNNNINSNNNSPQLNSNNNVNNNAIPSNDNAGNGNNLNHNRNMNENNVRNDNGNNNRPMFVSNNNNMYHEYVPIANSNPNAIPNPNPIYIPNPIPNQVPLHNDNANGNAMFLGNGGGGGAGTNVASVASGNNAGGAGGGVSGIKEENGIRYENKFMPNARRDINFIRASNGNNNQRDQDVLKDQISKSKNDLSHEANYKLSKHEQESLGNYNDKTVFNPNRNQPKNPNQQRPVKREIDRSANEINLKISTKLMANGNGPSLPSDTFNLDRLRQLHSRFVEFPPAQEKSAYDLDVGKHTDMPKDFDSNPFLGRKLLSLSDDEPVADGDVPPTDESHLMFERASAKFNGYIKPNATKIIYDDELIDLPNDLSHEADYKLSKIEQNHWGKHNDETYFQYILPSTKVEDRCIFKYENWKYEEQNQIEDVESGDSKSKLSEHPNDYYFRGRRLLSIADDPKEAKETAPAEEENNVLPSSENLGKETPIVLPTAEENKEHHISKRSDDLFRGINMKHERCGECKDREKVHSPPINMQKSFNDLLNNQDLYKKGNAEQAIKNLHLPDRADEKQLKQEMKHRDQEIKKGKAQVKKKLQDAEKFEKADFKFDQDQPDDDEEGRQPEEPDRNEEDSEDLDNDEESSDDGDASEPEQEEESEKGYDNEKEDESEQENDSEPENDSEQEDETEPADESEQSDEPEEPEDLDSNVEDDENDRPEEGENLYEDQESEGDSDQGEDPPDEMNGEDATNDKDAPHVNIEINDSLITTTKAPCKGKNKSKLKESKKGGDNNLDESIISKLRKIAHSNKKKPKGSSCNQTKPIDVKMEILFDNKTQPLNISNKGLFKRSVRAKRRRQAEDIGKDDEFCDLTSGRLQKQLVKAVMKLVHDNENLRTHLGPVLKQRKQDCAEKKTSPQDAEASENEKNKEDKVENLMVKLTALIDTEVRRKTCIQLKPDLKKFMEDMMKQNCKNNERTSKGNDDDDEEDEEDDDEDDDRSRKKRDLAEHQKIKENYRVLTELLEVYNTLPYEQQEKIADIKDYIQNHVNLLDQIEVSSNYLENYSRIKREISYTEDVEERAKLTERFRKLQETANFIQEIMITESDKMERFNDDLLISQTK